MLEIRNATKTFGGLAAVDRVSFSIQQGEVAGLLGPNGSGKTTLLNLVSGALPPSGGRILIAGRDMTGKRADLIARAGVARTFQLVRILPSLTPEENVMVSAVFGAVPHWGEKAREIARAALARVGLDGHHARAAGDLTYLDQKRLELARALAAEPKLLLLDEWLAGLNPTELKEGIALIRSFSETGITILMVEHIMEAVRALCPRCLVMNSGALIADGPTGEVLADPHVIAAYLGEVEDA
ncbi:ABC transporter ATP-binding protein [Roseibium salinum]|uniref:ABC transporter ATP-binding protein n=2 Tax=Roseibium salinum TaxID=1604349 RepID=A0ABT3R7G3_9HYPH|nr:ABC transporter ATP-binding protein [Roseibium sp. DSM 29163]MCX2725071.1 ABC transporter ATP-binding protein [Roseibium sp. DSM 29163]